MTLAALEFALIMAVVTGLVTATGAWIDRH
jgi:hypothetical protein